MLNIIIIAIFGCYKTGNDREVFILVFFGFRVGFIVDCLLSVLVTGLRLLVFLVMEIR